MTLTKELRVRCIPDRVTVEFHLFKGAKVIASSHSEEYLTAIQNCIEALALLRPCIEGGCGDCNLCNALIALEVFDDV